LKARGCPIDYPEALPRCSFRAEAITGYIPSCVYALAQGNTSYVIALRLATDRPSGTVITDWSFEPPWKGHLIDWDCEPEEVIPKRDLEVYKSLLKSRLSGVLNEGWVIRRGCPVEGVLCGRSFQPIGESLHGGVSAKSSFKDDLGNTVRLDIELNCDTSLLKKELAAPRKSRVFETQCIDPETITTHDGGEPDVSIPPKRNESHRDPFSPGSI